MSLDMLGAVDSVQTQSLSSAPLVKKDEWLPAVATIAGGAIGMALWSKFPVAGKKHPVLGLLDGMAIFGNVARVISKDITPKRAAENVGAHVIATASALSLSSHDSWVYTAIGWLAGAAGANLFLRREDTYLERMDETVLGNFPLLRARVLSDKTDAVDAEFEEKI